MEQALARRAPTSGGLTMRVRPLIASLALSAALFGAGTARAEGPSTRGPGYVQANMAGFGILAGSFGSFAAYAMSYEGGYHLGQGGHDGFALAFRQSFFFGSATAGSSQAKFGYAIPVPIKNSDMELTIEPYTMLGVAYIFNGGDPAFAFSFGADFRLFPIANNGFFVGGHPLELGGWISSVSGFTYFFDLGVGYAF
jgi:hypothetical protein